MNWNGQNDTIECLESVLGATYENLRIVVVDNGSTDGSVPAVSRWLETKGYHTLHIGHKGSQIGANSFMLSSVDTVSRSEALNEVRCIGNLLQPSDVILVRNDKNLGYALGNNVGMSFAVEIIKSEFVFLLNNDTVVDRLALTELMRAAESCKGSDIFGPMVCSYDSPDLVQPNCGRMSMWLGRRFPIIPDRGGLSDCCWTEVDYVGGAAMLIRASLISRIGYFDADYFMYTEDVDYCYRARGAGTKILFVPAARILHKVSKSSRTVSAGYVEQQIYRNAFLFMKKNARWYQWFTFLIVSVVLGSKRFLIVMVREPTKCRSIIRGTFSGLVEVLK